MRTRSLLGAVTVCTIVAGTAVLSAYSAHTGAARARERDRLALTQLMGGMRAETGRLSAVAEGAASLLSSGQSFTQRQFQALGARIATQPGIGYVNWMPRVPANERAAFERRIGGPIWTGDRAHPGKIRAPWAPAHFPVMWGASPASRWQVGFDPLAFPELTGSVQRTISTARMTMSAPVPMGLDARKVQTIFLLPVYRVVDGSPHVAGLVGAGVIPSQMVSVRALPEGSVRITDGDAVMVGDAASGGSVVTDTFAIGGREWTVSVRRRADASILPWLFWFGGLLLAGTVGLLFVVAGRAEQHALALVATRLAERRRVENELRDERDASRAMVDALQDGLLVLSPEGAVLRVNERLVELTGFREDLLVGACAPLPFWPADDDTAARAFAVMREHGHVEAEVRFVRHDGEHLWVILTAAPFLTADGGVGGHLLTVKDITRRRAAEQELAARASTDPLTGLANHRRFHDVLSRECTDAVRQGSALSVVLLDLDHFKQINDTFGHQAGDSALREVSRRLLACCRSSDTLARVGGEEFAWLMPGTDAARALVAVDRARREVERTPIRGIGSVTISAGICDFAQAAQPGELYRLADGALYWAKANGRNRAFIYTPDVVEATTAEEYATRMERLRTFTTVQALARAVDARDASTRQHSERVALLAATLARELGWSDEAAELLHGAGLVHDVGKIGVSDAILFKPGRLTAEEYEQVKSHAALGAQIVAGALSEMQARWVRGHHERWDGGGYPDGLKGATIPEGARILALADAWDVMTVARSYSAPRDLEDALRECRSEAGAQFWREGVDALHAMAADGRLRIGVAEPAGDGGTARTPYTDSPDWTIVGSPRKGGDPV